MNKTTYIILGIVAVIAIIAAIYFYKKSKETTIVIPPPAQGDSKTQGIFNLVAGLGTVLGNVNWQSIFGGNNNNSGGGQYNQPLDIQNCGGMARWNGTQCVQ